MAEKQTPLQQQYQRIKAQHPDKILFFRMGDFYEMFGADAETAAPVLGIALTSRAHGKDGKIPLAGVPYHSAEKYLAQLLKAGFKVAICEQTEDPKLAKGLVRREVVEIITPGTITVDGALSGSQENVLLSLYSNGTSAGLAALELTTGRVEVYESHLEAVLERAELCTPKEIIVPETNRDHFKKALTQFDAVVTPLEDWKFAQTETSEKIKSCYNVYSLDAFGLESLPNAVAALGSLISYVEELKFGLPLHLNPPRLAAEPRHMYLDAATIRNLEILVPQTGGRKEHSLLGLLDFCHTAGGKRLLARWLKAPLTDIPLIERRHQSVRKLLVDQELKTNLSQQLAGLADFERLSGKLGYHKASPRDLIQLKLSLKRIPEIRSLLTQSNTTMFAETAEKLPDLTVVADLIERAIVDEPPYLTNSGSLIKASYSEELDSSKASIKDAVDYIGGLQQKLRQQTGIPSLKVGYNRVFGYYIEVTKSHLQNVPDHFIRKQTLVNAERFITQEMKEREELIMAAEEKINALEEKLFLELREKIAEHVDEINLSGALLSEIDCIYSFAEAAYRYGYSPPELDDSTRLEIIEGRHPIIERILPRGDFVSNDTSLDTDSHQLQLLTGPNMAGKSTYLRQVGLIVIMAQAGSFVPAEKARIGVVDRVFTRVGASDRLTMGESTFLVEMNETSRILNNATTGSLILLDEVGRGTSTYDGLSIAWALCESLHDDPKLGSRTIFATHFHELTQLANQFERITNYQVKVRRWQDKIVFLRKVVPGGCDDSFGIEVAKLAGIPQSLTNRAKEILKQLEAGTFRTGKNKTHPEGNPNQIGLFERKPSETIRRLRDMDIEQLTPLEAINLLAELKRTAESEDDI